MKILIIYPGHKFSTIDVANGYAAALEDLGHEVKRLDYHNRVAFYEFALAAYNEHDPGFQRRPSDVLVLSSESAVLDVLEFIPDVVLIVTGYSLHRRAFDLIHRLQIPMILIATESPYHDDIQATVAKLGRTAGMLTNDRASLEKLREESGIPVQYLPHSYDPAVHHPRPGLVGSPWESDVFFFGTLWPERQVLFDGLLNREDEGIFVGGINPAVVAEEASKGHGFDFLENRELAKFYAATKIALNHNRTVISGGDNGEDNGENSGEVHIDPGDAWSMGPRSYEIAGCGTFQLTDGTRPEEREIFGDSIGYYSGPDDLMDQIGYYLDHEDERSKMSAEARARVKGCTFKDRATNILIPFIMEVI